MAYNELFTLAFVVPYIASGKKIAPEVIQEMMRLSLYHVKFYFSMVDLNTPKGKLANQKSILKYVKWYTPERERQYLGSFQVDFMGKPYRGVCYYCITRCPICA
ncbi:MAG: L-2-amino-thiazoline-4-carboxylic acid hydrolase [Eubacteriales bacterium]|nr:L-2-amino-thiazoline-4-carboxylic acid hydrolase [Eubacteriales bacterium]